MDGENQPECRSFRTEDTQGTEDFCKTWQSVVSRSGMQKISYLRDLRVLRARKKFWIVSSLTGNVFV
jgi:hypothetical protein